MAWGSHSEKEIFIGKVIFEISRKNDVHNNYETDYNYSNYKYILISIYNQVNNMWTISKSK